MMLPNGPMRDGAGYLNMNIAHGGRRRRCADRGRGSCPPGSSSQSMFCTMPHKTFGRQAFYAN